MAKKRTRLVDRNSRLVKRRNCNSGSLVRNSTRTMRAIRTAPNTMLP